MPLTKSVSTWRENLFNETHVRNENFSRMIDDGVDGVTHVADVAHASDVTDFLNPSQNLARAGHHVLVAGGALLGQDVQFVGLGQKLLERFQRGRQGRIRQARYQTAIVSLKQKANKKN